MPEIRDDVVVIERFPMVGVERRRRSPDQNCARDQRLQLRGLFQNLIQGDHHTGKIIRSENMPDCSLLPAHSGLRPSVPLAHAVALPQLRPGP